VLPVFDGHNDSLIADDHAALATGRKDGHLDLPRMRAGGMRGGIFAVFTPSSRFRMRPVARDDGVVELEVGSTVPLRRAAAFATSAAGRLLALERAGLVRVARRIDDVDEARDGDGPPVAVLHLEGAEAIDPELESLDTWYSAGLRSATGSRSSPPPLQTRARA
jgi:membrane dipeptidase